MPRSGIHRHIAPDIDAGAVFNGFGCPGVVTHLAWTRHGVKGPDQLAGAKVPGAGVARRSRAMIGAAGAFARAGAGDDQVLINHRRGRQDVALLHAVLHDFRRLQVDDAVIAEGGVGFAVGSAQGIKPSLHAAEDDGGGHAARARPIGGAARLGRRDIIVGNVVFPDHGAGGGVQRDGLAVGRDDVHDIADHQRNVLGHAQAGIAGQIGGLEVEAPGLLQLRNIGRGDLTEGDIAVGARILAHHGPVGAGAERRGGGQSQAHASKLSQNLITHSLCRSCGGLPVWRMNGRRGKRRPQSCLDYCSGREARGGGAT